VAQKPLFVILREAEDLLFRSAATAAGKARLGLLQKTSLGIRGVHQRLKPRGNHGTYGTTDVVPSNKLLAGF